jgi:hypothetical protein
MFTGHQFIEIKLHYNFLNVKTQRRQKIIYLSTLQRAVIHFHLGII